MNNLIYINIMDNLEFIEIINNHHKTFNFCYLSKLIDKYLIPQEIEKKQNAEVSTPYELREEMLNKIPEDFWTTPKKIFEPCSGKGGFLLDIIEKFMIGLKEYEEDEEKRYKLIVEECLYWSEYNSTNVYICKLLLDPENIYNLKYNEGDTLKLNIKEKWDIEGFEAVIGNPPYNNGKNSNYYVYFIDYAINIIKKNKYLLYVIPNRFLIKDHIANKSILNINPIYIKHSCKNFINISTDIGYILCKNKKYNNNILCEFNNNIIENIDLNYSTPTTISNYYIKLLSDKILYNNNFDKIIFTNKINNINDIFIKRQWTRYHPNKKSGGYHIFQIIKNNDKNDGKYTEYKEYIEWYLTKSNIIRFITKLYASNMNVPPFLWNIIPSINIINCTNEELYKIFNLNNDEINILENFII